MGTLIRLMMSTNLLILLLTITGTSKRHLLEEKLSSLKSLIKMNSLWTLKNLDSECIDAKAIIFTLPRSCNTKMDLNNLQQIRTCWLRVGEVVYSTSMLQLNCWYGSHRFSIRQTSKLELYQYVKNKKIYTQINSFLS